jgi:pimeloyl-ACP methyl ester carboxylesterase
MKKITFLLLAFWLIIVLFLPSNISCRNSAATTGKYLTINGLNIYYEETGKGTPLILLPGFTQTVTDLKPIIPQLSKYYRIIAIDLPGHGRSDYMDTTDIYLHKRATGYILGLLDKLQIDSADIMGISSGGIIALYMATIKPQLIKKLIIIGGQVCFSTITRDFISSQGQGIENPKLLEYMIDKHGKKKALLILRQFWNFRKLYGDPSFTPDELSTIKAKSLIIHGDNDPIAPVTNAWEMYRNIPKANLWIIPNGGHVPYSKPGSQDNFVRYVLEFLRGDWDNT